MTQQHTFSRSFVAMSSQCEIVMAGLAAHTLEQLADLAIGEIERIESKFSRYRPESIISLINAQAGNVATIACDDETCALLDYADAMFQASGGLFDVTSGVLRRAWDFQNSALPQNTLLNSLLALIGWPNVERQNSSIRLPLVGMEIDFGGFGKEYAADRVAKILSSHGLEHGYINMAGDVRVIGPKPDGSSWSMGIQHPRSPAAIIATIPLSQGALATSGDYERYFELAGKRYCHILNPKNGYPCQYWQSISVLAPLAVVAGSYTTIAMLKEAEAIPFLEDTGFPYLAIDQTGRVFQKPKQ